jgi:tetratricopeptide (TPR) repeat protein/transcriptional regulator with XRE-family HTH domain
MFGDIVRAHRRRLGLSQEELAQRAKLSVRGIGKIETGQIASPRPSTVRLLADTFGLTGQDRDRFCRAAAGSLDQLPQWSVIPAQLPPDVSGFTGRAGQLERLDALLDEMHREDTTAVVISAIGGTAGIGKTALAIHWAHLVAHQFPDGQLFIDLRGYTQGLRPVEPGDALDDLLRALGLPGPQIPAGLDQRTALYRTLLANRRMLIVLDNAAAETQVAPLIPGSPHCLVLVTSRRQLAGLDHIHTLALDALPAPEAVTLFRRAAGKDRLADQPSQLLAELVELCGGLPLALRIAAARLRSHPAWRLSDLVDRLRDRRHRLAELEVGQRSVTAALDLSYQQLSPELRHTYRLLGQHPGLEFDAYATAALLDAPLRQGARMLDQLLDVHLLWEPAAGRHRFHDLIRVHATAYEATPHAEPDPARRAAVDRLLDYYRHTASVAMNAAYPFERRRRPPTPIVRTPIPELADPAAALAWLDTELPNLLAATRYAAEHGRPAHIVHTSTILHRHLYTRGHYRDALTLHEQAVAAARATSDRAGQMAALTGLGDARRMQGRYEHATDHLERALAIARDIGDRVGELAALTSLGKVYGAQSIHEPAIDHFGQALQLAREVGDRAGERDALNGLGHIHQWQGRDAHATDHFRQALRLARAIGDRAGELDALNGLGQVHRRHGRYAQATDHYRQALQLARATGHHFGELNALLGLGDIHRDQGRYPQATDHYRHVLALAEQSDDPNLQYEAWQGLGRIAHATGNPEAAIAHHQKALALAEDLRQPNDQARAHDGLAHAYHALNHREQAGRQWQRALKILTDVGLDQTDDREANVATIRDHLRRLDRSPDAIG